ncbi:unnamed protein product [Taenia asiatica]|uniref:Subtilisin n=1 Tax=Taenia asiatica TaxID=60517 RepID=A0A0R3VU56_TAEAS|nr:unnamed protein product [Taenia asiatica]
MGQRIDNFDYRVDAVSDFYVQPHALTTSNKMANPVGPVFSGVIASSTWCPMSSWADAILATNNAAVKGLVGEVDSPCRRSECERCWCNLTLSADSGGCGVV